MATNYEARNQNPSKIVDMERGSDGVYRMKVDDFIDSIKKALNT
ncbi:MAG: hypothetical protein V1678_01115 [Candidatus Aenigmatarchaeota archaeon]